MLSSPDLSFSRTLPKDVFNQLGELLLSMVQAVGSAALVLTEAVLARIISKSEWQKQKFTLVVSEQFSALLVGNQEENVGMCFAGSFADLNEVSQPEGENGIEREFIPLTQNATLYASLTFNSQAIASFISQLRDLFSHDSHTYQHLERYLQIPSLNDATLQGKFTLLLLEYLLPLQNQSLTSDNNFNHVSTCQPIEDALKKQIYQERLLNQVTNQIRDLSQIEAGKAVLNVSEFSLTNIAQRTMESLETLRHKLIISCQAPVDSPLYEPTIIAAIAQASVNNGAGGVRIDTPAHISAVRDRLKVPIIGLWKQVIAGTEVYITPQFHHASAVAKAGADIIAIDATTRNRPGGEMVNDIITRIHQELGKLVMADVDTIEAAVLATKAGADIVGTTLFGYTAATKHLAPPGWELLKQMVELDIPTICEGGISSPQMARQAIEVGAFAVVVGTAITGIDLQVKAYQSALM